MLPGVITVKHIESVSLRHWAAQHATHGRAGVWYEAKLGDYLTWRCGCGARWQCTEAERDADAAWCRL